MARTILVAGACGSGKSAIAELGYERLTQALGPTASIETDRLLMMIDPQWTLEFDNRRGQLMFSQVVLLAGSFFEFGMDTVLVVGNALHSREALDRLLLPGLSAFGDVYHFTLDPAVEEIMQRLHARPGTYSRAWVETDVARVREMCGRWTTSIDNTALTSDQTLDALVANLAEGNGRLTPRLAG